MRQVKQFFYHGPIPEPVPYDTIFKFLSYMGPIGADVETPNLDDRRHLGTAFAISTTESFYFPYDSPIFPWDKLANPNLPIVFHNNGFDVPILEEHGRRIYNKDFRITNVQDSCSMAQCLGLPLRLSTLCQLLFGREPRNIEDLIGPKGKDQKSMDEVPEKWIAERACIDSQDCLEVFLTLLYKVPKAAYDLETRFSPVARKIKETGILIDLEAVHKHRIKLETELTYWKLQGESLGFSAGSTYQLAEVLEAQGYKIMKKRGKDNKLRPKLGKEILKTYYSTVPEAIVRMNYSSTQTLLTHLIKPLDEGRYLDKFNRIHPNMNTNVAQTGRLSRSNPATQNIKSTLRDIVIAEEGHQIFCGDFSQIELRWAAYLWDDKNMQEIFKHPPDSEEGDIHGATARSLIKQGYGHLMGPDWKTQRGLGKTLNFLLMYLGGVETMWQRFRIPVDVGQQLLDGFFTAYPGIANGIEETKKFALANGYTETYLGRRRDESEALDSGIDWKIQAAIRALVNHPIQGSAGESMKEKLYLDRAEPVFHTVHDEEAIDVPMDYEYAGYSHKIAPFDIPFEAGFGKNWQEAKP